ncbi:KIR protein [Plasmodium knowlesi strain H]|uniref:KIR protein n=3 Tax=Plasmodium knowlesi TaxID=5850 RepID=A0A5K1TWP8_PLAKH|nr:KIR protein [Plasmodium knowlesi strain H]OTN64213.1 KIR protein [Plasmodium knowlesi]CAA9991039.1 KIR protein [Plasmodium knowlesi strain H]SBO20679.1 KIR protein [Plasmodium knowlesi strain H]SBO21109.1 KIR protein [Plasmodium knowlesi strain H]VVS80513.1 KIR protein [Plasmodium knowlesi strain H]|eukprot:XP_002262321.1 KIR protein [Plasmodium knowlesi strain H]
MSTAPNLKNLPSRTDYYTKFNTGQYGESYGNSCTLGWEDKLKGKLSKYGGLSNMETRIMNAYCYACKKKEQTESDHGNPCRFFYYWLGNMVPKGANTYNLSEVLDSIYQAFEGTPYKNKCEINYEDVEEINFDLRRRIHDFAYNYKTIQGLVDKCGHTEAKEYLRYLQRISGACRIVGVDCPDGEARESGTYCSDYKEKYKAYCEDKLEELQGKLTTFLNPNSNEAGSSGSFSESGGHHNGLAGAEGKGGSDGGGSHQKEDDLSWLPSKEAYREIVSITDPCEGHHDLISEVQGALGEYNVLGGEANSIAKWFCYPLGKESTLSTDNSACYYLYYHVGDSYSSYFHKDDSPFWNFMDKISEQLGKLPVGKEKKCQIELSNIDKNNFIWEKRVYDFYKDYQTIKEKLQETKPPCSRELDQYLTEAAIGYKLIDIYCKSNRSTPSGSKDNAYCVKFNTDYKQRNPWELLNSTCKTELEDEISAYSETSDINPHGEPEEVPVSPATTPTVSSGEVSSTVPSPTTDPIFSFARDGPIATSGLVAVGLPAIAYFLYKHTSLPFWLHEQFGGRSNHMSRSRRRARRSTGPNFSNFTEDVSTEVPTEYSSYLSTLYPLEESIEDNSTTYYEESPQPSPRRRGQQQEQRRRRGPAPPSRRRERTDNEYRYGRGQNISYYRM